MRLKRVVAALGFVVFAPEVFGGVFYRVEVLRSTAFPIRATVAVDRDAMRIDFIPASPDSNPGREFYLITDRGRRIRTFAPDQKLYVDGALEDIFPPYAANGGRERITSPAVTVRTPEGTRTIRGYTAHHVIVEASWVVEAVVDGRSFTVPKSVVWDLWKTEQLPSSLSDPVSYLAVRTGFPPIDELLATHPEAVNGFALNGSITFLEAKSRTIITSTISDIDTKHVFPANFFTAPAGYVRMPSPQQFRKGRF